VARRPMIRFSCYATIRCACHTRRCVRNERNHRPPGHCFGVSPLKGRWPLEALNFDHGQIVEAALIRAEAIGRAKPHAKVAVKDQPERFSTVITSHGFSMRQTSFLALHLRSPFPRKRKTNAQTFGRFHRLLGPYAPCLKG
jgi:hypothetical protein